MISKMTYEEKLKELVASDLIEDAKWISDDEFIVWIYYFNLDDFIDKIKEDFGTYPFEDGGFDDIVMFDNMIALNLCSFLQGYFTEHLKEILPYKDFDFPNY